MLDSCGFVDVGLPISREDGSVVYNCCWPSPAQSFSGPSPTGLRTIFDGLKFEIPPPWWARSQYLYPPGTGWPNYTPRHWVLFSSPPTTCSARVEVFETASIRTLTELHSRLFLLITSMHELQRKHRYSVAVQLLFSGPRRKHHYSVVVCGLLPININAISWQKCNLILSLCC
jgi:hypothetical protein